MSIVLNLVLFYHISILAHGKHMVRFHGPLIRYVKLRVVLLHVPGMPGTFSPPPRVSNPVCIAARVSRTCRDTGIPNWRFSLKSVAGKTSPTFPAQKSATCNVMYLVRGPCMYTIIMSVLLWPRYVCVRWNYSSIPKLQRLQRWSLRRNK